MKVLLVEGRAEDASRIQRSLAETLPPCEVHAAGSLREAEPFLRAGDVEVVLLELDLPDSRGLETLQRVLALSPAVPVVVLTGHEDDQLAHAAVLRGAQDLLVKGKSDPSHLVRALRYAIHRRKTEENARGALRAQVAREQAELVAQRWRWLADATRAMGESLDPVTAAQALAQVCVPELGDCAMVLFAEDGRLQRVAVAAASWREPLARELLHMPLPRVGEVTDAFASGKPLVIEPLPVDPSLGEQYASLVQRLELRRVLVVPLLARAKVLGVLAISRGGERAFAPDEIQLAEDLALRGGAALDNARLYAREQAATGSRDELMAILSHDLRNPLNVISMAAANLRRHADPDARRKIEKIDRAVLGMGRLISDLMDVTRLEAGRLQLEPETIEVPGMVEEAVDLVRPLALEKGLALRTDLAAPLPAVRSEKERVLQVFSNLLGNAIKFTPPAGTITVQASALPGEVSFAVRDTGPGIQPMQLSHIFDRFWQARAAARAGAGLGLAIAKGIVEAHGGRIWVESKPGSGATFHFTLPVA